MKAKGLAIILCTGAEDRLRYALGIGLAARTLEREVRILLAEKALSSVVASVDKGMGGGTGAGPPSEQRTVSFYLNQLKQMKAEIYACSASLRELGLEQDKLPPFFEGSVGLATFLSDAEGDQMLFV